MLKCVAAQGRIDNQILGVKGWIEFCFNAGGPLHLGDIEELGQAALPCIVCPWHSWKFSLENGFVKDPAREKGTKVGIYPVQVTDKGELRVGFRSFSPDYFNGAMEFQF